MNYLEAIEAVKQNPEKSYIGIFIRSGNHNGNCFFCTYTIDIPDLEDPEFVSVLYQGGYMFSSCGEEGGYSLEDVPDEAKELFYKSTEGFPDITWMMSEYALHLLFPELPDPDDIWEEKGQMDFINRAIHYVSHEWEGKETLEAILI